LCWLFPALRCWTIAHAGSSMLLVVTNIGLLYPGSHIAEVFFEFLISHLHLIGAFKKWVK
jgi:hypothetical protein